MKRFLWLLLVPMVLAGCTSSLTNLTPQRQVRNPDNLYPVEVAFSSRQQSLRWQTIQPQIMVGNQFYTMRPTLLMTNRWEGLLPIPATMNLVHYRYKFDFEYNSLGSPKSDSALSPEYTLEIVEPKP